MKRVFNRKNLYRLIYLCLLGVLTPHTKWAFSKFEPEMDEWAAWLLAIFFEAVIAVLTEAVADRIKKTPNFTAGWVWLRKFNHQVLANPFLWMLTLAVFVSTLANLAHAVECRSDMVIFDVYQFPSALYEVSFGAILPITSLVYAVVLANTDDDPMANPELVRANETIRGLRAEVREEKKKVRELTERVRPEFAELVNEAAQVRINAAKVLWPELPGKYLAVVADSSPGYVSEVLGNANGTGSE